MRKSCPDERVFRARISICLLSVIGAKATSMQNLIKSLKSAGTPIDGVGLQCHFIVGEVPSTLKSNIQAFSALGVEVALTELDIRMTLPATTTLYNQQKTDYETVVSACNSVAGCIGASSFTRLLSFWPLVSFIY
jgi:endo-1,4-beta-xylanase